MTTRRLGREQGTGQDVAHRVSLPAQVTVFHVYSDPQPVVPVTGMPGNVPFPPPAPPCLS